MSEYVDESTGRRIPLPSGRAAPATAEGAAPQQILQRSWAAVADRLARPGTPPAVAAGSRTGAATRPRLAARLGRWEGPALAAVLLVAAVLNLLWLDREGYANQYYAATVRSMLTSWHNFFFASFDPGGFVTVDKPPLGFWLQAASAKLFGFHGWSLLLPQALAGVLSVALLWWLVRRAWGPVAGLVAALALAVTPISVVTNRNNTIDSLLVLCLLGAAWAVTRAVESPRHPLRWLLLGAVLVGLGFNIKMLEAYLALPALWLAYLVAARPRWYARLGHLVLATVVLLAVSLSWAVAVDLTPVDQRPYVGSSQTNSEIELALGYNGLQRLFGNAFGRGRDGTTSYSVGALLSNTGGGGGVGGVNENGPKGFLRLLDQQLGGQIGWTLPLAVAGLLAAGWQVRPRRLRTIAWFWRGAAGQGSRASSGPGAGPLRRRRASLALWGAWFLTMAVFFSIAGFYHRYYLTMLAPGIAAHAGIGLAVLWRAWGMRGRLGWLGWALPAVLVATAATQVYLLGSYPEWGRRLSLPILGVGAAAALALVAARLPRRRSGRWLAALLVGTLTLLVAPAVWSGISVQAAGSGMAAGLPAAGPAGSAMFGGPGGMPGGPNAAPGQYPFDDGRARGDDGLAPAGSVPGGAAPNRADGGPGMGRVDAQLLQWLIANRGDAEYIVAVSSANEAAPIVIQTGLPVMATGGFTGGDPILTADALARLVQSGTVRYFLAGGGGPGGRGGGDGSASVNVNSWVTQNCTAVPASTWGGTTGGQGGGQQLYACGAAQ